MLTFTSTHSNWKHRCNCQLTYLTETSAVTYSCLCYWQTCTIFNNLILVCTYAALNWEEFAPKYGSVELFCTIIQYDLPNKNMGKSIQSLSWIKLHVLILQKHYVLLQMTDKWDNKNKRLGKSLKYFKTRCFSWPWNIVHVAFVVVVK